jgi:hypothetical protein
MKGILIAAFGLTLSLAAAPASLAQPVATPLHGPSRDGQIVVRQVRPGGEAATGAMPAPATWALMIAGLGGVGALLRSQGRHLKAPI